MAAPDLIGQDFTANAVNQHWCGDITFIKTWDGWAYLATVIDLHSRAVVDWAIADHLRTNLTARRSRHGPGPPRTTGRSDLPQRPRQARHLQRFRPVLHHEQLRAEDRGQPAKRLAVWTRW